MVLHPIRCAINLPHPLTLLVFWVFASGYLRLYSAIGNELHPTIFYEVSLSFVEYNF